MTDKSQQKPTEKGNISPETGLTPQQEQAAMMLATGETITAVAAKLSLNQRGNQIYFVPLQRLC